MRREMRRRQRRRTSSAMKTTDETSSIAMVAWRVSRIPELNIVAKYSHRAASTTRCAGIRLRGGWQDNSEQATHGQRAADARREAARPHGWRSGPSGSGREALSRAQSQARPRSEERGAMRGARGRLFSTLASAPPLDVELDVRERLARQVAPPVGRERRGGACAAAFPFILLGRGFGARAAEEGQPACVRAEGAMAEEGQPACVRAEGAMELRIGAACGGARRAARGAAHACRGRGCR